MNIDNKRAVCVLFGGTSSEHEVSVASGASVLQNIDTGKYDVYPVGITKAGKWRLCPVDKAADFDLLDEGELDHVILAEGSFTVTAKTGASYSIPEPVVLSVLHGTGGEDGRIQGMLELEGVRFVGCGCASSAVCFDKALTKLVASSIGVTQAKSKLVYAAELEGFKAHAVTDTVEALGGYPVFVKPARSGSSVGVSKAKNAAELFTALDVAAAEDEKILIEECMIGDEAEIAVLEKNGELIVSRPARILPDAEFYTYDSKYNSSVSTYEIDPYNEEITEALRKNAAELFKALDCRGLARVDFFVTESGIVFNEINTLPGFTKISMYPKLMMHAGYSYGELISALIDNV